MTGPACVRGQGKSFTHVVDNFAKDKATAETVAGALRLPKDAGLMRYAYAKEAYDVWVSDLDHCDDFGV